MSVLKVSLAYRKVSLWTAMFQLVITLGGYFALLGLAILYFDKLWFSMPCMFAAGLGAVRLYMLQHDCMHRCFLKPKWLNDTIGILLSPMTLTPFFMGRYNHNLHHSHVGNLDRRDTFEINVMTLAEYRSAPPLRRILYRIYRSPVTLLLIGPFLVYAVFQRFPRNTLKVGLLWDVVLHNALLLLYLAGLYAVAGATGLYALGLSVFFGVSVGAFIPYVEHNFEDIHWQRSSHHNAQDAALQASAVLDFGDVFHWITANIGFHDLHHLNPSIPSYRLKQAYENLERMGLLQSRKITLREGIACLRWKLWDEDQHRMVTFAAA